MHKFLSTKVYDGYSVCYRNHINNDKLHGYALSFKVWFEGDIDRRNWVFDFGGAKRSKNLIEGKTPEEYFKWLLDHTFIVAEDDPCLEDFKMLEQKGALQLRILPQVGCERFAEFLFHKIDKWVKIETKNRVFVRKIEVREHDKNTAIYEKIDTQL